MSDHNPASPDKAALSAHQASSHFKSLIAGEALPLLSKRESTQYALVLSPASGGPG
jgi:hypothetical protein